MAILSNYDGSSPMTLNVITSEKESISTPLDTIGMGSDASSKTNSAKTDETYLDKFIQPTRRIEVLGVEKCTDQTALITFKTNLRAFSGVGENGTCFSYQGFSITTPVIGLMEDLEMTVDIGALLLTYSFVIVEGKSAGQLLVEA